MATEHGKRNKQVIDLMGKKFGMLTVIEYSGTSHGNSRWLCQCDCGNQAIVFGNNLKRGTTQSCGCMQRARTSESHFRHGKSKTRLYNIWNSMKNRCFNKKYLEYEYYGDRGIKVCDEWVHDFQAFYDWALTHGYNDSLSIDRIDVNSDYSPENCRWATMKEQQNNRRNNHLITYKDETHTLAEWAEIKEISVIALRGRIRKGWCIENALNTPMRGDKKK